MESIVHVLKPRWVFIIVVALAVAVLSGALSLLQPLKYSATVRLLITQKAAFTLDPYTALRSSELVGENLIQLVKTSSFLNRVLETGYNVDPQYFQKDEQRRRKLWARTIDASVARGTGLIQITVYHPAQEEAKKIAAATAFLLSTQGSDYIGRDIVVRLVDAPLISRFPVKPNIPLNLIAGVFIGALIASGYVWIDHRKRRHHGQLIG